MEIESGELGIANRTILTLTGVSGKTFTALCSLLIIAIGLRCLTLTGYFLADDFIHIDRAKQLLETDFSEMVTAFELQASDLSLAWYTNPEIKIRYFRPLSTALLVMDYAVWGFTPFGFHVTNLLLHLACIILVYFVARTIFSHRLKAWLTGLIFAIHPAGCEAVSWISARTELLLTFFFLIAMLSALKFQHHWSGVESSSDSSRREWLRCALLFGGVSGALALSLCAKETAVSFPVLCMLMLYVKQGRLNLKRISAWLVPINAIIVIAAYAWLRIRLMAGSGLGTFPPSYFVSPTDPSFAPTYLFKMLIYHGFFLFGYQVEPFYLWRFYVRHWYIMIILFGIAGFITYKLWTKVLSGLKIRWMLLWLPIALAPSALVFLGKRFLYLPLVGFALFAAECAFQLITRRTPISFWRFSLRGATLCAVIAGYFALLTGLDDSGAAINTRDIKAAITKIVQQLPEGTGPIEVHFADLWFPLSMGLDHALRLITDNQQIRVHGWYIFPHPLMREEIQVHEIDRTHFKLDLGPKGLLDNPASRFFLWGGELTASTITEREFFTLSHPVDSDGIIRSVQVTLKPIPNDWRRLILRFKGSDIDPIFVDMGQASHE